MTTTVTQKYWAAVRDALGEELERDPDVFLMGEDVGRPGGIYGQTQGLHDRFGGRRVRDTPAGEVGFMGAAVGAAIAGMRPIVEISFANFFAVCLDQLANQASMIRYMSGGQVSVPLTVLSFGGAGLNAGPQHSASFEATLAAFPGLKVVAAATPATAKGLVKAAVRDPDPVVVLLHKGLVGTIGDVPDDPDWTLPIGRSEILRAGADVTLVTWAGAVHTCLEAADALAASGISAEVVDLRSIAPMDVPTVVESVRRTHRLVVVQESSEFLGVGAEVAAQVGALAFDHLDAPITRVGAPSVPVPFSPALERLYVPTADRVVAAVHAVMA